MANASAEAKHAGVILSGGSFVEPHRPRDTMRRIIELPVREAMFARLVELARKQGRTPAQYAFELFEAAYSARSAPTGDRALDAAVAAIDMRRDEDAEAMQAAIETDKATIARLQSELDELRTERDAWRDDATVNDEALQAIGEEFGIHAGEHRIEGVRRILGELRAERDSLLAERDADRLRAAEIEKVAEIARARLAEMKVVAPPIIEPPTTRLHINGEKERSPESQAALAALAKAARDAMLGTPAIEVEPDAATIRAVRGLRAAGNSAIEVARTLKLPLETVRRILGGGK
jgi:hypothetical protein